MGWTFTTVNQTKADFVRKTACEFNITEYSVVGNQVWGVYRKDGYDPEIILILLSQNDGYWGYKPILESESPFYYDCPLKYINATVEPQGSNLNHLGSGKSWREFVRETKTLKTKKAVRLKEGDKISLDPENFPSFCGDYTVVSVIGRKGYVISSPVRGTLRLPCKQAKYISIVN